MIVKSIWEICKRSYENDQAKCRRVLELEAEAAALRQRTWGARVSRVEVWFTVIIAIVFAACFGVVVLCIAPMPNEDLMHRFLRGVDGWPHNRSLFGGHVAPAIAIFVMSMSAALGCLAFALACVAWILSGVWGGVRWAWGCFGAKVESSQHVQ
jgi:hypothetical protein